MSADYHRTFKPLPLPYEHFEARTEVFLKAGARTAWIYDNDSISSVPTIVRIKEDQNFSAHATAWELSWSKLASLRQTADPIVTKSGEIVGHIGWFTGANIFVPKGTARGSIKDHLDNNIPIFVMRENYLPEHWEQFSVADLSYRLVTTVDGAVLLATGEGSDRHSLKPVWFSPIDLGPVLLGKMTAKLIRSGVQQVVSALSRRAAARTVAKQSARQLAVNKVIQSNPPAVRLGSMGKPGNLFARVDAEGSNVIYRVSAIVLRGKGNAAEIALARDAHREMIRRAAQEAQKRGASQFTMRGIDANANFRAHADKLAKEIGVGGSGKTLAGSAPGFSNYQVTLDVGKALTGM